MRDKDLLKEVSQLGYDLLERQVYVDVNKTLYDVIRSKEIRLLEGFPVLLANAMQNPRFDYERLKNKFKSKQDRSIFLNFIGLSLALYKYNNLKLLGATNLHKKLTKDEKKNFNKYLLYLKENSSFQIMEYRLSAERIKNIFSNYFKKDETKIKEKIIRREELSLEYALSQIFSPKQKNLFFKKLRGEKMNKTEKEYYSRTVKKKVMALSNAELHRLAQKLLEY